MLDAEVSIRPHGVFVHLLAADVEVARAEDVYDVHGGPLAGEGGKLELEVDLEERVVVVVHDDVRLHANLAERAELSDEEEGEDRGGGDRQHAPRHGTLRELARKLCVEVRRLDGAGHAPGARPGHESGAAGRSTRDHRPRARARRCRAPSIRPSDDTRVARRIDPSNRSQLRRHVTTNTEDRKDAIPVRYTGWRARRHQSSPV